MANIRPRCGEVVLVNNPFIPEPPRNPFVVAIHDVKNNNIVGLEHRVKSKWPTNVRDGDDWMALHHACYSGRKECLVHLLNAVDLEIDAVTGSGVTALYMTCSGTLQPEISVSIAELLLEKGANPNQGNCLIKAISNKNVPLINLLIEYGADVNKSEDDHENPLTTAIRTGNLDIVMLITRDQNFEDNHPDIFSFAVRQRNNIELLEALWMNFSCLQNINLSDDRRRTCLYLACSRSDRKAISFLLEAGAIANHSTIENYLPVVSFMRHILQTDLNSSESLFGRLIIATDEVKLKKPTRCDSSFFHVLATCNKQDLIFEYVLQHFPNLYSSSIVAYLNKKFKSQSPSFKNLRSLYNCSPFAYWCGVVSSFKNYNLFHKMAELDCHVRDTSRFRIPPLIMAVGNRKPDLYVIRYLIRMGADVMATLGKCPGKMIPTAIHMALFVPSNRVIATLLINTVPLEIIFKGLDKNQIIWQIFSKKNWLRSYYGDRDLFYSINLLKNLVCVSKFMPLTPFDWITFRKQKLNMPGDLVKDNLVLGVLKTGQRPKFLWHLACLKLRRRIWESNGGVIGVPMCICIEKYCNKYNLSPHIKQILLFENICIE